MSTLANLLVKISADASGLDKGLSETDAAMKRIGGGMQTAGKALTLGLTAPLVAFGGLALIAAADFESAMKRVGALSGASGEDLQRLEDQAKQLGASTQFSAGQAADAMGFLAMAGFDADEILGAMPSTLRLAAAAQMDLAQAADITSNILTGYGMEVEDLAHANDVLVKAFTSANVDLSMLGESLKYVGPIARAAGVDFEEVVAAIGLLGNAGIQGSMAGTSLRMIIGALAPATGAAAVQLRKMGVATHDSAGQMLPLADIVGGLERVGLSAGDALAIFGQRAGPAMAALVSQGGDALRDFTTNLRDSAGTAEMIAGVQMQGLHGAFKLLKSAIEAVQIAIAQSGLLGWVTGLITKAAELLQGLSQLSPGVLQFATVVGVALAALGPLLFAFGTLLAFLPSIKVGFVLFSTAMTALPGLLGGVGAALGVFLISPLGLGVAALGALIVFFPQVRAAAMPVLEAIGVGLGALLGAVWPLVAAIGEGLGGAFAHIADGAGHFFGFLGDAVAWMLNLIPQAAMLIGRGLLYIPEMIARAVVAALQGIGGMLSTVSEWMHRLSGGRIDIGRGLAESIAGAGNSLAASLDGNLARINDNYAAKMADLRGGAAAPLMLATALVSGPAGRGAGKAPGAGGGGGAAGLWSEGGGGGGGRAAGKSVDEQLRAAMGRRGVAVGLAGVDDAPRVGGVGLDAAALARANEEARKRAELTGALDLREKSAPGASVVLPVIQPGLWDRFQDGLRGAGDALRGSFAGALGGLKESGLGLLNAFNPLTIMAQLLEGAFKAMGPTLDALKPAIEVVAQVFGAALAPILVAMLPIFKLVAIAATYVGQVFFEIAGGIAVAVGGLIRGLGTLIGKIPGLGGLGKTIAGLGQGLLDIGRGFQEGADALAEGRAAIRALDLSTKADDATDAVEDLAESAEDAAETIAETFASSLTNVPEGFRIFNAAAARFASTMPGAGASATPGHLDPVFPEPGAGGGDSTVTQTYNIHIEREQYTDGAELWREVKREIQRDLLLQTGEAHGAVMV
jgi:TP901 family phage tail tape measure protein